MPDDETLIVKGAKHTFRYGVVGQGDEEEMPAKAFLDELDEKDSAHIKAVFRMVADSGIERAICKKKFRPEREFYAAKKDRCKGHPKLKMVRIVCFRHGSDFVVMFGFWKPNQAQWPESQFTRAAELKKEMLAHKSLAQPEKKKNNDGKKP